MRRQAGKRAGRRLLGEWEWHAWVQGRRQQQGGSRQCDPAAQQIEKPSRPAKPLPSAPHQRQRRLCCRGRRGGRPLRRQRRGGQQVVPHEPVHVLAQLAAEVQLPIVDAGRREHRPHLCTQGGAAGAEGWWAARPRAGGPHPGVTAPCTRPNAAGLAGPGRELAQAQAACRLRPA